MKNDRSTLLLSLVIPFYNESSCIDGVCSELHQILSENSDTIPTWECILVDDGSQDRTGPMIEDWAARHGHFRAVRITPNSGQSAALQAGFQAARGLYVATMDGDGQNDPRDLPLLLGELQRRHVDMMCGIRARRADSFIRRASSPSAESIASTLSICLYIEFFIFSLSAYEHMLTIFPNPRLSRAILNIFSLFFATRRSPPPSTTWPRPANRAISVP